MTKEQYIAITESLDLHIRLLAWLESNNRYGKHDLSLIHVKKEISKLNDALINGTNSQE